MRTYIAVTAETWARAQGCPAPAPPWARSHAGSRPGTRTVDRSLGPGPDLGPGPAHVSTLLAVYVHEYSTLICVALSYCV